MATRGGKRPGAGRPKGVPNKVTTLARSEFLAAFKESEPDLRRWLRETGDGWEETKPGSDGQPVTRRVGKDPAKAAALLIGMAEYHFPKLGRQEHVGEGGGPIVVEIRKYG